MGICWTRIGWMMAGRNTATRKCQKSTPRSRTLQPNSRGDPAKSPTHPHRDDDICIVVSDSSCPVVTSNNLTEKQEMPEEPLSPGRISMMFATIISKLPNYFRKETELKLDRVLREKTTEIDELRSRLQAQDDNIRHLTSELDRVRRSNLEIQEASDKKARQLKLIIEEKGKDLETEKVYTSQLEAKCLKLEADLALIEKQAAQESLTSGSYSDDHANPGMVEGACKAVDNATEALARYLHNNSATKGLSLKSPELEQFVRRISPAHPAEFSRAIQVKYVWAHWICHQMFWGFEHVFFDADGGHLTSPLDSKKHALECFQGFQQRQSVFTSDLFQAFCSRKFESVLPPGLVLIALTPPGIVCDENGRFQGDGELHGLFMDVAKAVWLLHKLAYSFDPPASILRMAKGVPYDKQFHESVIHVEENHGMSSQMAMVSLMIRPAFRVRKSIIRSRVFLCNTPAVGQHGPKILNAAIT